MKVAVYYRVCTNLLISSSIISPAHFDDDIVSSDGFMILHGYKIRHNWLICFLNEHFRNYKKGHNSQRYTYRVLQTIQMKLILLCAWAEPAILGSTKTALKFKYEKMGYHTYNSTYGAGYKLEK